MNNSTKLYENLMREAIKERNKLSTDTIIRVRELYEEVANDLINKAESAKGGFTKAWNNDYEKYMRYKIMELDNALVELSKDSIKASAEIAASVNGDFLSYINNKYELDIDKDFINMAYSVNNDVIGKILQGGLYKDNRSLSERIWNYNNNTMNDIQHIITKGMAEQKDYKDIIKDLELYVDPKSKKPWDFGRIYPNLKNKQVDYNAQRLLRTSINHSFFVSNMAKAKDNPYVEAIHWNLSSAHYERQIKHFGEDICDEYASQDKYKLGIGNFPKENVPLPHPQCMCFQSMVIPKTLEEIGKELGKDLRSNYPSEGNLTFNTVKEATKYLKDNFGYEKVSLGNKMELDVVNSLVNNAKKVYDRYPQLKGVVKEFQAGKMSRTYAYFKYGYDGKGNILTLRTSTDLLSTVADAKKYYERDLSRNFHPQNTTWNDIIVHELGHVVEFYITAKKQGVTSIAHNTITRNEMTNIYNQVSYHNLAYNIRDEALRNLGFIPTTSEAAKEITNLSRYASKNAGETLAEAFADALANGDKANPLSKEILKIIDREMK